MGKKCQCNYSVRFLLIEWIKPNKIGAQNNCLGNENNVKVYILSGRNH